MPDDASRRPREEQAEQSKLFARVIRSGPDNVSVHLQPKAIKRAKRAYNSSADWCNRLLCGRLSTSERKYTGTVRR